MKISEKAFILRRKCSIMVAYLTARPLRPHARPVRAYESGVNNVASLLQTIENAVWNILHRPSLSDIMDILIVAVIIYQLLMLTRGTRGSAVINGLLLLLVVVGVSNLLGLTALNWLLMTIVNNGAVVLVVLFQPELRKALEQIGRGAKLEARHDDGTEGAQIIEEVVHCLLNLSRRHVGALIVFERKTGLKDIIENGIPIDAKITSGLLENIFEPNTPLHDGAVVVQEGRVAAAACILNLAEGSGISHDLGTRHRAAIGVSETTDAIVLIVSEETGIISMAQGGKLSRHLDAKSLREILGRLYTQNHRPGLLNSLLGRGKAKEGAQ